MAQKLKFGNGTWATKKGSTLAYNDENDNYKPLPFTTTRDSIATRVNKEGLIEVVGNDIPRIDYKDSTEGALLLENSATNLIAYSNKFDTYWSLLGLGTGTAPTINSNNAISPDGTQNATEVILNVGSGTTTSDRSSIEIQQTISQGSEYTISFYIKGKNDGDQLIMGSISGGYELITLTTEWKRYVITQTAASSPRAAFLGVRQGVFGTLNNNVEFYLYGAQLEQGSYPTSYIPTSGSSVTRQADTANGSGNSEVYGNNGGVLFWNAKAFDNIGNLALTGSNGTNAERFQLYFDTTTSDRIKSNVVTGNVAIAPMQSQVLDVTTFHKCANSFANNNHALWVDGFKVDTDTSGGVSQGVDRLNFDNGTGTSDFYGKTKEIGYYDTALTDEELEYLTSYRSLNELVTELNLNTL
jgi:hypothetical protein